MVKEKQTRTYDKDGYRKRAACLCVRDPEESQILLVTSSRDNDHWIVPGGGVEPNEDPSDAAIRETEEEAGVRGVIKRRLGDFEVRDENKEKKHRTSVFVLEVTEELQQYEDSNSRGRRWFPIEEALRLLSIHKPVQCPYVHLLIQTSPSLSKVPLPSIVPSSASVFPCKSSPSDPSSASQYLHMAHYPCSENAISNSNANFHTFICTRDVYSIDSETTEDLLDSSNHFVADVNRTDVLIGTICDADNTIVPNSNDCPKQSEILPIAESSVNS